MTEPTYAKILPRDLTVGQRIRVNVPVFPYRHEMDCEVVSIDKVQKDGTTKYKVVVIEPREDIPNIPFGVWEKNRKSTRYFSPGHRVQVAS